MTVQVGGKAVRCCSWTTSFSTNKENMKHFLAFVRTASVKRTQFPLTLSWACAVHRVESLSSTKGVVSFELESQKSFNQGQMHAVFSRIASINELYLLGKYNKAALKVN